MNRANRVTKRSSERTLVSSGAASPRLRRIHAAKIADSDKENEVQQKASATQSKRKRADPGLLENNDGKFKRAKPSSDSTKNTTAKKRLARVKEAQKVDGPLNKAPTAPLDIFVFGEGALGELGLGSREVKNRLPYEVLQPRLNPFLSAKDVGVVQLSCGGLHGVALTKDNKIFTWGVNDHGALGRDTKVEEEDEDLLNPAESTPAPVDLLHLGPGITWVQVVGCDNASFALTEDGKVYGWGTFRGNDGVMGFRDDPESPEVQKTATLIPELKNIIQLAAGTNHVLALDSKGKVYAWGCGQQAQIGRLVPSRRPRSALRPDRVIALPIKDARVVKIACGSYHSFAIDQKGRVFAWGLNNYGQLGISDEAGENNAHEMKPRFVESLRYHNVVDITGGQHHSLAANDDGELLAWGRIDGYRLGLQSEAFTEENTIFDEKGNPRILATPTIVPDLPAVGSVAAGADHSFTRTLGGRVYSWGFSYGGRTGQNTSEDDIEVPTLINSKFVRDRKFVYVDAGGPFSVLAAVADMEDSANSSTL
ncbi:RCC1/BLIP-II [Hypoxylon trugodes]|uniref:RCC1/BLIP-II n=1 Tax=Hypoxylon trugodes TaxID=326681 RepID=UPI00219C2C2C|nr:RCC1/BLIP-II [Hypoxylon trugodes]KAI1385431.1 RCC1/BLIP-II [Hypoxylon trugodes]